jgi:hypothetical protein
MDWTASFSDPARTRVIQTLTQASLTASALFTGANELRFSNWNSSSNTLKPALSDEASHYMENAFSGLPPAANLGNNTIWYQIPFPVTIYTVRGDTEKTVDVNNARFIGFSVNKDGHYIGKLATLPTEDRYLNGTSNDFILVQSDVLTPVLPDEFTGNDPLSFLVRARQSGYVNQQSLCYKELSIAPLNKSTTLPDVKQQKLEQLFNKLDILSKMS